MKQMENIQEKTHLINDRSGMKPGNKQSTAFQTFSPR